MPNHLSHENSPYLLQHQNNPVDWYPWSDAALKKARQENKPIFLSIGYAACHWCHVMEAESFEDPETASILNAYFINIKVDREERPDLDSLFMNAVVAITGQGGWPMSVFLTPDGKPFYGGTYFPPVRRYNMPAFRDVLVSVSKAWNEEREKILSASEELLETLQRNTQIESQTTIEDLDKEIIKNAVLRLEQNYDWENGGWGAAPKFPQPMAILFLLSQAAEGNKTALEITVHALKNMAKGGMYDVIGGGFSRYSTDNSWLVPHFEKMLYDNALLARAYLHTFLLTGDHTYRILCEETIDFVLREMTAPEGGFLSSLDADSEGEEGKYYLWSMEEIEDVLENLDHQRIFIAAYQLTPTGNFEGRIVLQRQKHDDELARQFNLDPGQVQMILNQCRHKLFIRRNQRIRPAMDDKVLLSWNAFFLHTLAEAARYLNRDDYLNAAKKNANFLMQSLYLNDSLYRSWRNGKAQHKAYLEDYASLILGLVSLYQSCHQPRFIQKAFDYTNAMIQNFYDEKNGFYDSRIDHEQLFMRPKDIQDNATPSGTSLAVQALLHMAGFYDVGDWRSIAETILGTNQTTIVRYPTAFANWLSGLAFALAPVKEVAILGDSDDIRTKGLIKEVWKTFRPNLILAASAFPPPKDSPPLLSNRGLLDGQPTAYVCQNFNCNLPVTNPADLADQIN